MNTNQNVAEIWKNIPTGIFKGYQASSLGRIRKYNVKLWGTDLAEAYSKYQKENNGIDNDADFVILNQWVQGDYYVVKITLAPNDSKHILVHRLVCRAFNKLATHASAPKNLNQIDGVAQIVNHKDADKFNNKPSNLEWCDYNHNIRHAYFNDRCSNNVKVQITDVTTDSVFEFNSLSQVGRHLNISDNRVPGIIANHGTVPYEGQYTFKILTPERVSKAKATVARELVYKDYVADKVVYVNSAPEATMLTGIDRGAISNRICKIKQRNNNTLLGGYIFRDVEDADRPWPVFSVEAALISRRRYTNSFLNDDVKASGKMVEVKDYATGVVTEYQTLRGASDALNPDITDEAEQKTRYKYLQYYFFSKHSLTRQPRLWENKYIRYAGTGTDWPEIKV